MSIIIANIPYHFVLHCPISEQFRPHHDHTLLLLYAPANEDYVSRSDFLVTFAAGETEQFVDVMLLDNDVVEGEQMFQGLLVLPAGSVGVILGADEATASISDNDGNSEVT